MKSPRIVVVVLTGAGRLRMLVAILAATCAGCLPTGSAPSGRHLLTDRSLSGVHFSPSETEGIPSHLLATGPAENGAPENGIEPFTVADLYQIPVAPTSETAPGPIVARLLAEKCIVPQGNAVIYEVRTDIRGRLLAVCHFGPVDRSDYRLSRMDLVSASQEMLGYGLYPAYPGFLLSPGRTRVVESSWPSCVWELDGSAAFMTGGLGPVDARDPTFLGEDLYVDAGSVSVGQTPGLWRVKPHGQLEVLEHYVGIVMTIATDRGPRLVLERMLHNEYEGSVGRYSLFDPETLKRTRLPTAGTPPVNREFGFASADGHWLVFYTSKKLILFNWVTSEEQEIDDPADSFSGWEWRPLRNELWLAVRDGTLRIWKPESGVVAMPTATLRLYQEPGEIRSAFTRDGKYWFSARPAAEPDAAPGLYIGSADDPGGPTFEFTPPGAQAISYWELADGRVLAGAFTTTINREDYFLVDPRTGARREFSVRGGLIALGHTRALAYVDYELGSGSARLCLIDLATGAMTLLAENVYDASVDPGTYADVPPGADVLAPGTRIAFLVRNRLESPYDGLWVAELP